MRTEEIHAIEAFVGMQHGDFARRSEGNSRFFAHPGIVSRLATTYARRLFHNKLVEGKQRKIEFTKCAGLLVYSMEGYGCNFEDVARMSDLGVAELVSTVSADPRETRAKRNLALRMQLSEGSLLAQIVKFAEIEATAQWILETYTRERYREDPVAVKDWVIDSEETLRAMHRLVRRKRFAKPYARLHRCLAKIDHALERSKRKPAPEAVAEVAFATTKRGELAAPVSEPLSSVAPCPGARVETLSVVA